MNVTYITRLIHFLDENGKIPMDIGPEARAFGSYLALIVDTVTEQYPATDFGVDTGIGCRSTGCEGIIIGALDHYEEPVHWYCLDCGNVGRIWDWQGSNWDNTGISPSISEKEKGWLISH